MRKLVALLLIALSTVSALPAHAQSLTGVGVEGNWGCRAIIDGTKAGLLTIYAGSYGYASANFASVASGSGNVEMASTGVTFQDGNLIAGAGIMGGTLGFDANGRDTLTLFTAEKPVLICTPR
jgi:hypothetical protein